MKVKNPSDFVYQLFTARVQVVEIQSKIAAAQAAIED